MDTMLEALESLREKYKDAPKPPDVYILNWHEWCKLRLMLKESGTRVEYRHTLKALPGKVTGTKRWWQRYINGVITYVTDTAPDGGVFVIRKPKIDIALRQPFEFPEPIVWSHARRWWL